MRRFNLLISMPLWSALLVMSGVSLALTACGAESVSSEPDTMDQTDTAPGPGDITNVCCLSDGESVYTTNVDCTSASGVEVSLLECPVMCCHQADNTYAEIPPVECAPDGLPTHPGHCLEVCCQVGDDAPVTLLQGNCDVQSGVELDADQCGDDDGTLCCRFFDGTFGEVTAEECADGPGQETNASSCEEVCCQAPNGTVSTMLAGSCVMQSGLAVDDSLCDAPPEKVCCLQTDGTYAFVASGECESGNIVADVMCEAVLETVCCELSSGVYETVLIDACPAGQAVDAALCEPSTDEVCCKNPTGPEWVSASDCVEQQLLPDALCDELFCCKIMEGPNVGDAHTVTATECQGLGGMVVYDAYCEQTVCCDTESGPQLTTFDACTFAALLETGQCEEEETYCCKIMQGPSAGDAVLATMTDCAESGGAFVAQSFCDEEVCCKTDDGPMMLPYVDCTFLALLETTACEPPPELGCCKDMENPGLGDAWMATAEDCFAQGGAPVFDAYCTQEVCCDMGQGPTTMPYMDCTFLDLIATFAESDAPCDPPEEQQCCKIVFGVGVGNALMATPSECAELGGIATTQEYCDMEVCCDMGQGPVTMPYMDCTFFALVATYEDTEAPCEPPEEPQCCQIVLGPQTGNVVLATPSECAVANGVIQAEEYCTQDVCCDDGSGPQLLSLLECAFLDVVSTDQCPEEEGCCKISFGPDTGNVLIATPSECEALQGIMTDLDYCQQMMCCSTEDGPQMLPFTDCPFADVLSPDACTPAEDVNVCCQLDNDTDYILQSECSSQNGVVIAEDQCSLCCKNPYGNGPEYAPPGDCDQEQPEEICEPEPTDAEVCCLLEDGSDYILQSACDAAGASTGTLMDCRECCLYPDGATSLDFVQMCLDGDGIVSEPEVCQPAPPDENLCCQLGEDFNYIPASECTAQGGATAAPAQCIVCCEYSGGTYASNPAEFCLAGMGTIVADALCEPPADDDVCCQIGEDASYISASECSAQSGSPTSLTACQVCCKNPNDNGPEWVFPEDCDPGQVQPESVCE